MQWKSSFRPFSSRNKMYLVPQLKKPRSYSFIIIAPSIFVNGYTAVIGSDFITTKVRIMYVGGECEGALALPMHRMHFLWRSAYAILLCHYLCEVIFFPIRIWARRKSKAILYEEATFGFLEASVRYCRYILISINKFKLCDKVFIKTKRNTCKNLSYTYETYCILNFSTILNTQIKSINFLKLT